MKKILIVEDQPEARKMLAVALQDPQHAIVTESWGGSAMLSALEQIPDVVLLDILMPGEVNGFNVCEWIRSKPELKNVFVIMTSGLSDPKDFEEARRVGANAYLVKPFRLSRLAEIVRSHAQLTHTFTLERNI